MLDATPLLRAYARLRQHRRARRSPAETQADTLRRLVAQARGTRFGREHGFADIRTVADFQRAVPLRDYEAFHRDYFAPTFPLLDNVTWPGRIPFFAVSSGTTSGRTKHIPVSRQMLHSNARAGTDLLADHVTNCPGSEVLSGKSFLLGGSVAMTDLGGGVCSGDLSGIARLNNPRWSTPFVFPALAEALDADWDRRIDRLARLSLDEPIRCIAGTPSWLLLFLDRLAALAGGGHDIGALYPGLELMVYGGMSFRPYRSAFEAWCGGRPIDWREVYSASEGFVASADRGVDEGMRLNLDIGLFYEFVPVAQRDAPDPPRYVVGTAPPGEYALVLSTCAGLWAYCIGDVVELLPGDPPRVRVTGRTAYFLNAFGEHLSGDELERAVLAAAGAIGIDVVEFAVTPLYPGAADRRGRHRFVVELARPATGAAAETFAQVLDHTLRAGNEDYDVHRQGDVQLMAPDVAFVSPGAFARWMAARGKLGGQNKVPRVVHDGPVRDSLLEFARGRSV
ncbi:MAG: GH3 auxin-responsive promoter family protein [Acuticoccus sp.]